MPNNNNNRLTFWRCRWWRLLTQPRKGALLEQYLWWRGEWAVKTPASQKHASCSLKSCLAGPHHTNTVTWCIMNNEYVQLHTSGYRNQNRSPKFKAKLSTSASVACPLCAKNKTHSAARAAENTCVIIITLAIKTFQAVSNSWKGTVLILLSNSLPALGECMPASLSLVLQACWTKTRLACLQQLLTFIFTWSGWMEWLRLFVAWMKQQRLRARDEWGEGQEEGCVWGSATTSQ